MKVEIEYTPHLGIPGRYHSNYRDPDVRMPWDQAVALGYLPCEFCYDESCGLHVGHGRTLDDYQDLVECVEPSWFTRWFARIVLFPLAWTCWYVLGKPDLGRGR